MGEVISINISSRKGTKKKPIKEGVLKENWGLVGDAHSGPGERQVSLLSLESIERQAQAMRKEPKLAKCPKTDDIVLKPGDFGENITTKGIDLSSLPIGKEILVGEEALLRITKRGKECHRYCSIYYQTGSCIMPKEGIFAQVVKGGKIKVGDRIFY
jgi:MOSC domain-containing protein YiiM